MLNGYACFFGVTLDSFRPHSKRTSTLAQKALAARWRLLISSDQL